jgi:hypothetical protein
MASFDTLNYSKWDSLDCSSDDEPQRSVRVDPRVVAKGTINPRASGAATVKADGSKQYSVQMSNRDGPCVVEEDAPPRTEEPDKPFETQLAWQNDENKALVQVALPEGTEASAAFSDCEVYLHIQGMDAVRLPHPPVDPKTCRWAVGQRLFHGSAVPKRCLALELRKATKVLWPQNTFGGGTGDPLKSGEEIECAWRQPTPMLASTPTSKDDWRGEYKWQQDNERVSVWFAMPPDVTKQDVTVTCLPRFLIVEVNKGHTKGKYQRRLTGACIPAELVWQFDDDLGKRRLRVEVVMRDLRSWEDGPFLPEMSRKEAAAAKKSAG